MNNLRNKFKARRLSKNGAKSLIISIVILVEIFALCVVGTFAWVETVSSIKVSTDPNDTHTIDSYVFTEAMIGEGHGTIDLDDYFKKSGNIHLSPCSSADGLNMYFPKVSAVSNNNYNVYRKGNTSDKNTTYLSVTFKVRADTNADFYFTQAPTVSDDIRVSVTAYTEGTASGDLYDNETGKPLFTKVYANSASTTAVVSSTTGATGATEVEKFSDHIKGKASNYRLFRVGAYETKIVTVNVWLQKKSSGVTDLTTNMSTALNLNNLGITSSLTPRHVTLLPTPTWDTNGACYYAWCWDASNGDGNRLYKLALDDNEHYSFNYNGTYQKTTFVRAVPGCTVQAGFYNSWPFTLSTNSNDQNSAKYWNQTVDITIPNDPVDPTYVIQTISGGTDSKSTGSWIEPVNVNIAYVTGQDDTWGDIAAATYIGTSTSTHVLEQTNSGSSKHQTTVHGWSGKRLKLSASADTDHAFVGWYSDPDGAAEHQLSVSANYDFNISTAQGEDVTYYAKFKEVRTFKIQRMVDGSKTSTAAAGTITINGSTTGNTATSKSVTVDMGSTVTYLAAASTGYTLQGIYTAESGGTKKYTAGNAASSIQLDSNTTYFARFTVNPHDVIANARFCSTVGGTSYSTGNSGGTVKVGSANASSGTTYTSSQSVNYGAQVELKATPASGYAFVGWYNSSGNLIASDATTATYNYTLNTDDTVNIYGRFLKTHSTSIYVSPRADWNSDYYVRLYQSGGSNVVDSDNGFVKADYDSNTGYYKATFTTTKTGSFSALIAKDTNHTDKVPSSGGYTGNLGTSYVFKHNQSASALTAYSSQRCIWFIDGTDNHFIGNNDAKMRIDNWSNVYDMRSIGNYCYVYEYTTGTDFSNASGITFKRTDSNNNQWNYWNTSPTSGKSQYTADQTGDNHGYWSN